MAAAAFATQSKQLYTLTAYGRGFIIKCEVPSQCDFYGQKYLTIAEDATTKAVSFWNDSHNGWIVRGRDYVFAEAFVKFLNNNQTTTTDDMEAAEALASMNDEAEVMLGDEPLYTMTHYGRGYLIECNDPKQSTWWGEKYIALSNRKEPAVAFWNASLEGYIVKGRDAEEAEFFIHLANRPSTAPKPAEPTPSTPKRTRAKPAPVPATPRRSARLAAQRREEPPAAPVVVRQTRRIAHPEVPSRTFQMGPTVNFIRKFPKVQVRRRLFAQDDDEMRFVWGGEAEPMEDEMEDRMGYVCASLQRGGDGLDDDYVPDSEEDEEDDDGEFDRTVYQPYKGMTLRPRPGDSVVPLYWLTCGADHKLYGRPYLGYPAAKAVRANCWKVEPNAEKQYIDGGAVFQE